MNIQDIIELEEWINEIMIEPFSHEESILALYLFSETLKYRRIKSFDISNQVLEEFRTSCSRISPFKELCKNIAAASVVLSTKILGDGDYFTIADMEYIRPPFPPFMNSKSIIKAEKIILEVFDYNLVNAANTCFNIEPRYSVYKQISSR